MDIEEPDPSIPWPFVLRHYHQQTFTLPPDPSLVRIDPSTSQLLAATPPHIVFHITSPQVLDYDLITDFFLTFREFMPAYHVLELLLGRLAFAFTRSRVNAHRQQIAVRTFVVLRYWILNFFADDFVPSHSLRHSAATALNAFAQWKPVQINSGFTMIVHQLQQTWIKCSSLYWDVDSDTCVDGGEVSSTDAGAKGTSRLTEMYDPIKQIQQTTDDALSIVNDILRGKSIEMDLNCEVTALPVTPTKPGRVRIVEPPKKRRANFVKTMFTSLRTRNHDVATQKSPNMENMSQADFTISCCNEHKADTDAKGVDILAERAFKHLELRNKDTPMTITTALFDSPCLDADSLMSSISSFDASPSLSSTCLEGTSTPAHLDIPPYRSQSRSLSPSPARAPANFLKTLSACSYDSYDSRFTDVSGAPHQVLRLGYQGHPLYQGAEFDAAVLELANIPDDGLVAIGKNKTPIDVALEKLEGRFRKDTPLQTSAERQTTVEEDVDLLTIATGPMRAKALERGSEGLGLGMSLPVHNASSLFSVAFRTPTKQRSVPCALNKQPSWFEGKTHTSFLLSHASETIASQLTLVELAIVAGVDWLELLSYQPSAHPAAVTTSWTDYLLQQQQQLNTGHSITDLVTRFNLTVSFIKSQILLSEPATRPRLITKLIHVAAHTRRLRNYASTVQIALALGAADTSRGALRDAWQAVSDVDLKTLKEIEALVSPVRNFGALRRDMEQGKAGGAARACVPFLGVILSDLNSNLERPMHVSPAAAASEEKLVNFERFRTAAQILKRLFGHLEAGAEYARTLTVDRELIVKLVYLETLSTEDMLRVA